MGEPPGVPVRDQLSGMPGLAKAGRPVHCGRHHSLGPDAEL